MKKLSINNEKEKLEKEWLQKKKDQVVLNLEKRNSSKKSLDKKNKFSIKEEKTKKK